MPRIIILLALLGLVAPAAHAQTLAGTTTVPPFQTGSMTATTDATGLLRFNYQTPEMGGSINLRAEVTVGSDSLLKESPEIIVRVPGLVELPENATLYQMVGGTCGHTGPGAEAECLEPNNNHFAVQTTIDAIQSITAEWYSLTPMYLQNPYIFECFVLCQEFDVDNDEYPLFINDISLPNGGLFDIDSDWIPSYDFHRVGRDVDVRTTRWLPGTPGGVQARKGILLTPEEETYRGKQRIVYKNTAFERIVKKHGANRVQPHFSSSATATKNGNEHYHVYFY